KKWRTVGWTQWDGGRTQGRDPLQKPNRVGSMDEHLLPGRPIRDDGALLLLMTAVSFASNALIGLVVPFLPHALEALRPTPPRLDMLNMLNGCLMAVFPLTIIVTSPAVGWRQNPGEVCTRDHARQRNAPCRATSSRGSLPSRTADVSTDLIAAWGKEHPAAPSPEPKVAPSPGPKAASSPGKKPVDEPAAKVVEAMKEPVAKADGRGAAAEAAAALAEEEEEKEEEESNEEEEEEEDSEAAYKPAKSNALAKRAAAKSGNPAAREPAPIASASKAPKQQATKRALKEDAVEAVVEGPVTAERMVQAIEAMDLDGLKAFVSALPTAKQQMFGGIKAAAKKEEIAKQLVLAVTATAAGQRVYRSYSHCRGAPSLPQLLWTGGELVQSVEGEAYWHANPAQMETLQVAFQKAVGAQAAEEAKPE
ncbi:hypothetical protein T492DRAFT_1113364, partial [Pavlovales sp. CCMP2436]